MTDPREEVRQGLRKLAEPSEPGEHIESIIRRVGRVLGWPFWRTRSLWYGQARRIDAVEIEAVRAKLEKRARYEEGVRRDAEELHQRLSATEAELAALRADMARVLSHLVGAGSV